MVQRQVHLFLDRFVNARRLFWTALLVMHLSALRSEWEALAPASGNQGWGTSLLRTLALAASAVFFFLKVADVRWLRLHPDRRSIVASLVVIGLLHLNVLERITRTDLSRGPAPLGIVLFAGTVFESDLFRRAMSRIPSIADAAFRSTIHPQRFVCGLTGPAWEQAFKPHFMRIVARFAPLRAPPS
jgi:hypothetical protein